MRTVNQRQAIAALWLAIIATAQPFSAYARIERFSIAPSVAAFYPEIPNFNSQRLNQQLQLYRQYLLTVGVPDILIIGSSRSLQGIDPQVMQRSLAAQGYGDFKIYNFSVNGATAQVIDLIVRQLLLPDQLPRMLIWGDGLRAFNNGRPDATYAGILSSAGYQQLQRGQHPIPTLEPLHLPQYADLNHCVEHHYRAEYSTALRSPNLIRCQRSRIEPSTSVRQLPLQSLADLEVNGFRRVFTQFQPTSYFQQFPRVPGNYDGDYVPFQLQGSQMQATQALARYARQQHMTLLLVSLPLSQEYLDQPRLRYERQFQQQMQVLAQQEGILLRNWSMRWASESQLFADPSHLNQYGAEAVALAIAADPTIPWASILEK